MKKFLILCDLDSTLLTDKKIITKKTIKYIQKITKKGHIFSICTGRPYQGCNQYYKQLGINSPMITENGSNIYFEDHVESFLIPLNDFKTVLTTIDEYIVCAFTGTKNHLYIQEPSIVPFWIIHEDDKLKRVEGKISDNITEDPNLPSLVIKKEGYEAMISVLKSIDSIDYRYWGEQELGCTFELFSKKASKGLALRHLKEIYNIEDTNTMAFGDQLNDSSMIEEAHYGVAMINGVTALKKISNVISKKDNNHNGVIKEIDRIIKLNK